MVAGVLPCFGAVVDADLAVDVVHVPPHRAHAHDQRLGDLAVGEPGRQQAEYFYLPRGETGRNVRCWTCGWRPL